MFGGLSNHYISANEAIMNKFKTYTPAKRSIDASTQYSSDELSQPEPKQDHDNFSEKDECRYFTMESSNDPKTDEKQILFLQRLKSII